MPSVLQVPICLDLGTNTEKYHSDPLYLGVRQARPNANEACSTSAFSLLGSNLGPTDGRVHGGIHDSNEGRDAATRGSI